MLRLISWNVAGRVKKLTAQVDSVAGYEPHVVALQEVTKTTIPPWRRQLEDRGYWVATSFDLVDEHEVLKGGRKYAVLMASHWPMKALPPMDFDIPWTERVLSVIVNSPWGQIECHNAHLPAGVSHRLIKVETFEGIYRKLSQDGENPRIPCGDFNSPQRERIDGTTVPFGTKNERWSAAELSVIKGLGNHDLRASIEFCMASKGRK